jgi:hypothetical protein
VFTALLALVPFLPLYIERTMLRSWLMNPPGTMIEWGWKLTTLNDYWSNYIYFQPEQRPALWLALNFALAFAYALIAAVVIDRLLRRRRLGSDLISKSLR